MERTTLIGKFIRLEPLLPSHLHDLEEDFDPSLFDFYPKPYANARDFVEENFLAEQSGTFLPFAIVLVQTGEAIGCSEFSGVDLKNRKAEIGGSWLRPIYHGSAANSEAKYLMLQYAFLHLGFHRVQFTTNALNERSRAALGKIGAIFEGVLRNVMILPDGKLRDDAYFSIISQEWPKVEALLGERIAQKLKHWKLREHA